MARTLKWIDRGDRYSFAIDGSKAYRAVNENDGWRIDRTEFVCGAQMPWEAMDSVFYADKSAAKDAIIAKIGVT